MMKKILFILVAIIIVLAACFGGCMLHNNSAKKNYQLAKNYVATNSFNSDSSQKYIGKLDAPSCILCLDGFHQEDSVLQLVIELKTQDTIAQLFDIVREKLNTNLLDFSDLQNTKRHIDSFPQIKTGLFMYDKELASLYNKLSNTCTIALFMDNVSAYLQEDEWDYNVLTGHLKQLRSLDIMKDGTYMNAKYKNFKNRYNQLTSDRKLRGRLNKGEFWSLVDLYNEDGIQNNLYDNKYTLLKDIVQDEKMFNGFYAKNKAVLPKSTFTTVKNLWNSYKDEHAPKVAEQVEQTKNTDFEVTFNENPKVEDKKVETPKKETTIEKKKTEAIASTSKKETTKAKATSKGKTKETKPTAAANRSYSEMMYGDEVAMDESKVYSSDSDILQAISSRSTLYQLNKNQITSSSSKAKVQQLKNMLDKVTESEYSHCYSSSSSLQDMLDAMTKATQNR